MATLMTGRVVAFGKDGLGIVEDDQGHQFGFHSTAIADGSRSVSVGATVTFAVYPGHRGKMEAGPLRVAPGEATA